MDHAGGAGGALQIDRGGASRWERPPMTTAPSVTPEVHYWSPLRWSGVGVSRSLHVD